MDTVVVVLLFFWSWLKNETWIQCTNKHVSSSKRKSSGSFLVISIDFKAFLPFWSFTQMAGYCPFELPLSDGAIVWFGPFYPFFLLEVDTVKRMCIKKLPRVLAIQLKRFDYDWER